MSASLSLESKTKITFNVLPVSGKTVTLKLDGKDVTGTPDEKGVFHVTVEGIAATDLATPHTLAVSDGTTTVSLAYSALSWAYSKQANDKDGNIAKALYAYYLAAAEYLSSASTQG